MNEKMCIQCGNQLSDVKLKYNALYCSKRCKLQANMQRFREKNKNNLEYLQLRREEWKRIRARRKELGLCPRCGHEKDFETSVNCADCYEKRKANK